MRDTTLVAVSRAPYEKLAAYRARMGWTFPWYSSYGSDFNDLTALGRQEAWEEPMGRAVPLGLHVGGSAMRLPDEYDT